MKNVRFKKKLTLDSETIRDLKVSTTAQLVRARGGAASPIIDSGGDCSESWCVPLSATPACGRATPGAVASRG